MKKTRTAALGLGLTLALPLALAATPTPDTQAAKDVKKSPQNAKIDPPDPDKAGNKGGSQSVETPAYMNTGKGAKGASGELVPAVKPGADAGKGGKIAVPPAKY